MQAFLFVPCLVEDFMPEIGEATITVLRRAGWSPVIPKGQTCCGQPLYKTGHTDKARDLARHFIELFEDAPVVVSPSGSCVSMVRHYPELFANEPEWRARAEKVAGKVYELSQFLVDVARVTDLKATLDTRAVYHDSCQVGRALGVKTQPLALLENVRGLTLLPLERAEMCCGFGGALSMQHPDISDNLLSEKATAIFKSGADTVVSAEVSCLLNLKGYMGKKHHRVQCLHIAQVLASQEAAE